MMEIPHKCEGSMKTWAAAGPNLVLMHYHHWKISSTSSQLLTGTQSDGKIKSAPMLDLYSDTH